MTFVRFAPSEGFDTIKKDFNKIFNEFPGMSFDFGSTFVPKIDVVEDNDNLYVAVELPGIQKDNVKISIQENVITLEGEKLNPYKDLENNNYLRNERSFGKFKRSFSLPEDVDADNVNAKFTEGLLQITIGKAKPEAPKERTIEIN